MSLSSVSITLTGIPELNPEQQAMLSENLRRAVHTALDRCQDEVLRPEDVQTSTSFSTSETDSGSGALVEISGLALGRGIVPIQVRTTIIEFILDHHIPLHEFTVRGPPITDGANPFEVRWDRNVLMSFF